MCRISNHSICHDGFWAYRPLSTDIPKALLYNFVRVNGGGAGGGVVGWAGLGCSGASWSRNVINVSKASRAT